MKKNKGFTLIELLVVIAIIGILASVVLASLSSARSKGKDAAVKSQIASMKAQAELYYSTNETYLNICTALVGLNGFGPIDNSTPEKALIGGLMNATVASTDAITSKNVTFTDPGAADLVTCHDGAESWVVDAPLSTGKYYCADSTGTSKEKDTFMGASDLAC